jgi:hypothetical protein
VAPVAGPAETVVAAAGSAASPRVQAR